MLDKRRRKRYNIVAAVAAIAFLALLGMSIYAALAKAQSPTGGTQYQEGPSPHNVIVTYGLDYKTGEPRTSAMVYFGTQFVQCGSIVDGIKVKCGKIARIVPGTDKFGRPSRNIKLTRHEKLAAVFYSYESLVSNTFVAVSDWTGAIRRQFPLRATNVFDGTTEQTELSYVTVLVNNERFQPYDPPDCGEVSCGK